MVYKIPVLGAIFAKDISWKKQTQPTLRTTRNKDGGVKRALSRVIERQKQPEVTPHPINITPEDVLRDIFDWLSLLDEEGEQGWTLVQVCQVWRYIAITSPLLWSKVRFKSALPLDQTCMYWSLMASRIRSTPVTIEMNVTSTVANTVMDQCPLDAFPNLACIVIRFSRYAELEKYLYGAISWIKSRPMKPIDKLCLTGYKGSITKLSNTRLITDFIAALSPSTVSIACLDLDLSAYYYVTQSSFSTVRHLTLSSLQGSQRGFYSVLRMCHSLESLKVERISIRGIEETDIPFQLKRLSTINVATHDFPWGLRLKCPNLQTIVLEDYVSSYFLPFLRTNPTITTMEWPAKAVTMDFNSLADASKHLTHIMVYTWFSFGVLTTKKNGKLPLPFLHSITIMKSQSHKRPWNGNNISKLVQIRCLGKSGAQTAGEGVRVLQLQEGVEPCDELNNVKWSLRSTERGFFREYLF